MKRDWLGVTFGFVVGFGVCAIAGLVALPYLNPPPSPPPATLPPPTTQPPPTTVAAATPEPEPPATPIPAPPVTVAHAGPASARSLQTGPIKKPKGGPSGPSPEAIAAALKRSFVPDLSTSESLKGAPGKMEGFDTADVEVKRAAGIPGRVEFEVEPAHVKPGDKYTVKVYLLNTGKKDIGVKDVQAATIVNGERRATPATARIPKVAPAGRGLLDELPGEFPSDPVSWSLEVLVTSSRGDVYKNQLAWK